MSPFLFNLWEVFLKAELLFFIYQWSPYHSWLNSFCFGWKCRGLTPVHLTAFLQQDTFSVLKPLITGKDSKRRFFKNSCKLEVNVSGITQVLTSSFADRSHVQDVYWEKIRSTWGVSLEVVRRQGCKSRKKKEERVRNECMEMVRVGGHWVYLRSMSLKWLC